MVSRQSTMLDQLLSEREQIDQHFDRHESLASASLRAGRAPNRLERQPSNDQRRLESELQMMEDSFLPDSVSQQHSPSQFSQHLPPHDQLPDEGEFNPREHSEHVVGGGGSSMVRCIEPLTPVRHISDRSFDMNGVQVPWRSTNLLGHLDFPIASESNHISDSYTQPAAAAPSSPQQDVAGGGDGQDTAINRMKRWYQQRLTAHAGTCILFLMN